MTEISPKLPIKAPPETIAHVFGNVPALLFRVDRCCLRQLEAVGSVLRYRGGTAAGCVIML